jgi:methyl-accepting chemotaxis protein
LIPALGATRQLVEDVSPKLKVAAQNVLEASHTLRTQSAHVTATVDDLLQKAEGQIDRVDEMVTATLNTVAHATATMQRAVVSPVRQVGAVLTGLRAGFDVLRNKEPEAHAAEDGDHFV